MAKRGDYARQEAINTITNAFSALGMYVGFQDKKIYVYAKDGTDPGSEKIQFAISLTMPKNPIAATGGNQPTSTGTVGNPTGKVSTAEISDEDRKKVDELMAKLGLT